MIERELIAHRDDGGRVQLRAPQPGIYTPIVRPMTLLQPGDALGTLDVLGQSIALVVPAGYRGLLVAGTIATQPVEYDQELGELGSSARDAGAGGSDGDAHADTGAHAAHAQTSLVFRAPTSGRYYGRPSPDKPAFVTVGQALAPGATVCLLEVMKTFNRVAYSGAPAKVRELLVADGADVNAGDPLVALDPA